MRVVIAHDFAETYGGAERVAGVLAETFPDAPFWAILGRDEVAERMGVAERFHTVLPARERLLRHYRALVPLYPPLVRARALPEADVLLTSHYAFAHWFRTANRAPQVCYCHSPLRFAWSMTDAYAERFAGTVGPLAGRAVTGLAAGTRAVDRRAARGVDRYVANSRFVAAQIALAYGHEAEVLWPPVDCAAFRPLDSAPDDYFLLCGRLVEPYKRAALAIAAFETLPFRLVVAGDGPALPELRRLAGSNVEFVGRLDDAELIPLMQRCAAAVFPSRDDFGLIPVEVMACGRPVIAYAAGGALESVVPGLTGELFEEQTVDGLRAAVARFDPGAYSSSAIRRHAETWDVKPFQERIRAIVDEVGRVPS